MNRLAHVCIETRDLDRTETFYRAFGLRRQFDFRNQDGLLVGFYLAFDNEIVCRSCHEPETAGLKES